MVECMFEEVRIQDPDEPDDDPEEPEPFPIWW